MPSMPRRPRFYLGVRVAVSRDSEVVSVRQKGREVAAKAVFTYSLTGSVGPVSVDLLVISFTLGPVGIHVSLLSLVGVLLAYLIARSLF